MMSGVLRNEIKFHRMIISGGYFANSLAIMTDAAHMLSDFASFMISLFAVYIGQKKPTRKMSFGYYRAGNFGLIYPTAFLIS